MSLFNINGKKIDSGDAKVKYSYMLDNVQYMIHAANTVERVEKGANDNFHFCEVDISFTKDNIPVGSHDDDVTSLALDPSSGMRPEKPILLSEILFEELAKYKINLTTFEEILYTCKRYNLCVLMDIKSPTGIPNKNHMNILYDLIVKSDMKHMAIWSTTIDLKYLIEKDKNLIIDTDRLDNILYLQDKTALTICNTARHKTKDEIADLHKSGIKCYAWTIDDSTEANELFDKGVDYVCTNTLKPLKLI